MRPRSWRVPQRWYPAAHRVLLCLGTGRPAAVVIPNRLGAPAGPTLGQDRVPVLLPGFATMGIALELGTLGVMVMREQVVAA